MKHTCLHSLQHLVAFGVLFTLTSCSLLFDAADITMRRSREVAEGTVIAGDGFTVGCPARGLYPAKDVPTRGGVVFRPVEPLADGEVFFVTPFQSSSAQTSDQALVEWNSRTAKKGRVLAVIRQQKTTFAGLPATRAVMNITENRRDQIAVFLVVKRASDFLILARGDVCNHPTLINRTIERCESGLASLQRKTSLVR